MKRSTTLRALLLASGLMLLVGVATTQAEDWWGHTVTAQWRYPDFESVLETHDVVVGDGIELTPDDIQNDDKFSIDLGDNTVLFEFNATSNWSGTAFNGWWFGDTDGTIPEIIGYSIDGYSGGVAGLTDDDLGFNADAVWGNFSGVTVAGDGDYIRLRVDFIPEPASVVLLALGAVLLRRR